MQALRIIGQKNLWTSFTIFLKIPKGVASVHISSLSRPLQQYYFNHSWQLRIIQPGNSVCYASSFRNKENNLIWKNGKYLQCCQYTLP